MTAGGHDKNGNTAGIILTINNFVSNLIYCSPHVENLISIPKNTNPSNGRAHNNNVNPNGNVSHSLNRYIITENRIPKGNSRTKLTLGNGFRAHGPATYVN